MNIEKKMIGQKQVVSANPQKCFLKSESDIMDLLSECYETREILLHKDNFDETFFDLKSGFAGVFLQKIMQYTLRCALVIDRNSIANTRFCELMRECDTNCNFRFFNTTNEASKWLNNN